MRAEKAFDDLVLEVAKMAAADAPMDKRTRKVEKFLKDHAGTAAADRARDLLPGRRIRRRRSGRHGRRTRPLKGCGVRSTPDRTAGSPD